MFTLSEVTLSEWIISLILVVSALLVITLKKPVYAALAFLLSLFMLSALYLQLSAQFIGVMQLLVYAGAILVIFIFVIVLFQDAHQQLSHFSARSRALLLYSAGVLLLAALLLGGLKIAGIATPAADTLPADFGTVQILGKALYLDFFFPFEAVILLFLIALIGGLYIARAEQPAAYSEKEKK